jgi:hypothetical protein
MLLIVFVIFSQFEPFLFCLDLMDQRFHHPTKNKSSKFIFLKHAYSTELKSSKNSKISAKMTLSWTVCKIYIQLNYKWNMT